MSGIAEVLINLGYQVTGSDLAVTETTRRLERAGGKVLQGHHPFNVEGAHVVVVSSAVGPSNIEVESARKLGIPVIPRAEMLAELMRLKYGIAVAGSHGKTTTTSMIASVLAVGGLDPTAVIGGKLNLFGGHSKLGQGDVLVAEADESDGSFLKLSPTITVVTNIDREHLDYYRNLGAIKSAFVEFMNKIPFYGAAVVCVDDEAVRSVVPEIQKRKVTYGFTGGADFCASGIETREWRTSFAVTAFGKPLGAFRLKVPGAHNVMNALAAIAVGLEMDVDVPSIQKALEEFGGVDRRFHFLGERNGIMVVDDYGHHPTEIRATLAAARKGWPDRRLVVAFQPHRFTRTRDLMKEFGGAFEHADILFLTDIYAAGEEPLPGITAERLAGEIRSPARENLIFLKETSSRAEAILPLLRPNDLLITLGAGDIWKTGQEILRGLS